MIILIAWLGSSISEDFLIFGWFLEVISLDMAAEEEAYVSEEGK